MEYTNGWIKEYADGTRLAGRDEDVATGKASWTRTPLANMVAVHLCHGNKVYSLRYPDKGITDFWQSDDYEASVGGQSVMVRRRVQMLVGADWFTVEVDLHTGQSKEFYSKVKI